MDTFVPCLHGQRCSRLKPVIPILSEPAMNKILFFLTTLCCLITPCLMAQNTHAMEEAAKKEAVQPEEKLALEHIRTLRGPHINSPKSVIFSPDGSRFYINSLEGLETVVYNADTFEEVSVIRHEFGQDDAGLFLNGESTAFDYEYFTSVDADKRNCFGGKPVEAAFSHNGRYLWVTYYRRTWDHRASSPSAVAVIDTAQNRIVRVIPTGPLPKMITASPDGKTMAVIHWGDNTIGLIDISSDDPQGFTYKTLLTDGKRLNVSNIKGDRDAVCGHCLRGAAFSADSRYLFVGRMHNGGITVFDLETMERIGTYKGVAPTPRHIILSQDGTKLYLTSNSAGVVTELPVDELLQAVKNGGRVQHARALSVGRQARTLTQSPDGKYLFVACNVSTEVSVVDIATWKKIASAKTTPYTVGLAVSPRGDLVITTSQGRKGRGGHAVDLYRISPPAAPARDVQQETGTEPEAVAGEEAKAPCTEQAGQSEQPGTEAVQKESPVSID